MPCCKNITVFYHLKKINIALEKYSNSKWPNALINHNMESIILWLQLSVVNIIYNQ